MKTNPNLYIFDREWVLAKSNSSIHPASQISTDGHPYSKISVRILSNLIRNIIQGIYQVRILIEVWMILLRILQFVHRNPVNSVFYKFLFL